MIFAGFRAHGPAGRVRGPRDGVTAAFCAARRVGQVGDSSWASSQINGSTGLLLAMSTHPSNSSNSLGQPLGSVVVSGGASGGCVFRDSPSGPRARGDGLRRSSLRRALGLDSTERRCGGIPNTLTSSGSGLKQSAFASAFSRPKVVWWRFPFFSRTSLHDLCDESPGAGRGPARPRAKPVG